MDGFYPRLPALRGPGPQLAPPTPCCTWPRPHPGNSPPQRRAYRRALTGVLAAACRHLPAAPAVAAATPRGRPGSPLRQPGQAGRQRNWRWCIAPSPPTASASARPAAAAPRCAGRCRCSTHLAPIDLRPELDVHERVVAELLKAADPTKDWPWMESGRIRCSGAAPPPASSPWIDYSEESQVSWPSSAPPGRLHLLYGKAAVLNCIISKTDVFPTS